MEKIFSLKRKKDEQRIPKPNFADSAMLRKDGKLKLPKNKLLRIDESSDSEGSYSGIGLIDYSIPGITISQHC